MGIGSQLDGLGHIGVDNVYFNCNKAAEFVQANGLKKLGIEKVPPAVTRGVVLNIAAYFGVPVIREGQASNSSQIQEQARRQGFEIRRGDVVLFHTGWQSLEMTDPKRFVAAEPGLGKDGALWVAWREVVHQILLARNGIYLLENMNTAPLVADRAWELMFVLGAPRWTGAVQAIINPVAIR